MLFLRNFGVADNKVGNLKFGVKHLEVYDVGNFYSSKETAYYWYDGFDPLALLTSETYHCCRVS